MMMQLRKMQQRLMFLQPLAFFGTNMGGQAQRIQQKVMPFATPTPA